MSRPVHHMRPIHPGEVLREDFLIPLGMSVNALALQTDYDLKTLPTRAEIRKQVQRRATQAAA